MVIQNWNLHKKIINMPIFIFFLFVTVFDDMTVAYVPSYA